MFRRRVLLFILLAGATAHADVTLLTEEPYGTFGALNPTGHAALFLSRVCAATPVTLRRCKAGETGVVISRYYRVGGYDWIAVPLVPYLYAVEHPDQIPAVAGPEVVTQLREQYRQAHLRGIPAEGNWWELVGESYIRTIYTFGLSTTEEQDDRLIAMLNSRANESHFSLLSHNCADFARQIIDFYYPHAVHRDLLADAGIMTPKQAARCVMRYGKKHSTVQFSSYVIPQVPGSEPRSTAVRGVLEALTHSKKYAIPLAPLAVVHPLIGGGMAVAWLEGLGFKPQKVATQPFDIGAE